MTAEISQDEAFWLRMYEGVGGLSLSPGQTSTALFLAWMRAVKQATQTYLPACYHHAAFGLITLAPTTQNCDEHLGPGPRLNFSLVVSGYLIAVGQYNSSSFWLGAMTEDHNTHAVILSRNEFKAELADPDWEKKLQGWFWRCKPRIEVIHNAYLGNTDGFHL